jgi:hypothetical protein
LATTVYEILPIELQDGTEVRVRPLDLKRLRKVMKVIEEMNAIDSDGEVDTLDFLIDATKALDLPTMWKILEISAGISMGNPNLPGEAALPGLI